ncbi:MULTISPECIES: PucR family transcriptional regulator [Arthrobacter]|uniref:PucR family transcriptional regulator ligand-binding domain-containing protein n=1 Tax=Arthrobacter caoxuetaonis TaxID=2886935 RepID=A0A9X1SAT4_9MICC|nr:PucR family transcriptional regulator ligand-binding domain-containing protein [Arthrobacter caoxuetaonis]MCC3281305.1 PucR family transcriptional regulator ligand-binding domain-containing protein [Arthrobacter caoxuetaonis]MCC3296443.1 PucR family transcriptional regulator ligand-binding domain-containing protein [Arthrobacter caoxuetaonis]MCC9192519.1 PucR family transcriptional regulator ligand-binding domain-containing protein [Arthrobacter sp. zg-Y916]USQ56723.1 PucR family transcripti
MPISLTTLLDAENLGLAVKGTAPVEPVEVQWVAVTELEDPSPFLSGGEVVLTTGIRQRTGAVQRRFVESVHRAGALAIGFGTGLSQARVPGPLLEEANRLGVPVFEVPYDTPFIAIGKLVADALSADHTEHLRDLLSGHQILAQALLSGQGLAGLLRQLGRILGSEVALYRYGSRVFSTGEPPEGTRWHSTPIATGMRDRCTLEVAEPFRQPDLLAYAQSLISVELNNLSRRRARERVVNGQLLADVVAGKLSGQDAVHRLRAAGVDTERRQLTLLVEAVPGQARLLPSLPLPALFDSAVTAICEDRLALLVADGNSTELAAALGGYLREAGITAKVGAGGAYAEPAGLRWGYYEAKEGLLRGAAVNEPDRLSLASLLMASRDVPLADLAAEALDPLTDFDKAHDAELVPTLEKYLALNGSVAKVAQALGLHRNTVRYRLSQIADLSGYDPSVTADRVHLYLALNVRRLAG